MLETCCGFFFWDKSLTISWDFVAIIIGIWVLLHNGDFRRWNPKIDAFYTDFILIISTLFSWQIKNLHSERYHYISYLSAIQIQFSLPLCFGSIFLIRFDSCLNHVWIMYSNFLFLIYYCKVDFCFWAALQWEHCICRTV